MTAWARKKKSDYDKWAAAAEQYKRERDNSASAGSSADGNASAVSAASAGGPIISFQGDLYKISA